MNVNVAGIINEYFRTKPIEKAWVFGSFSRNEERPDSDVDILVSLTPNTKFSLLDHSHMVCELEELLQRRVDLVKENALMPFAVESANNDKILVYERSA